jgi:hypothetical protein
LLSHGKAMGELAMARAMAAGAEKEPVGDAPGETPRGS